MDHYPLLLEKGTVKLSDCLTLFLVSHALKLKCNLLSVRKLTKETNCVAKLCGSKCLFHYPILGKMIANVKEYEGYIISRVKGP